MKKKDLLRILKDLTDEPFKDFKWYLKDEKLGDTPPIQESRLEEAERRDVVDQMVQNYGFSGAVEVMKNILKEMSRNDLVEKLSTIISGAEDQEKDLQRKFHTDYLLSGEQHLTMSQTNSPQTPKPIDQSSTGHSQAVKERIAILEKRSLTHKGLQDVEKQFKLVEDEFRRAHHPEVKILRGVNSVILEGPDDEVQLADTKFEDPIKQSKEKRVKLSAALITFMTSSGVISKCQIRVNKMKVVLLEYQRRIFKKNLHPQQADEVQKNISDKNIQMGGAERKISIVVLGTEDHLKKNLISLILGRDVFTQRISDLIIETYCKNTYEVIVTPNFYTGSEDIRRLFSSRRPDICLLVVEDEFTPLEVWHQIEKLHEITGKPTKDFIVVLPLGYKPEESYPFKIYTMYDLFNKLRKLTEEKLKKLKI